MKGLLKKDIKLINNYKKSLILFLAIFLCTGLSQPTFLGIGFVIAGMSSVMATFSYDEQTKWDRFALTLPVTRKDIVKSKYVLLFGLMTLAAILSFVGIIIIQELTQNVINIENALSISFGGMVGILLVEIFLFPIIFKCGIEKGRIMFILPMALITLLIGGLSIIGEKLGEGFTSQLIVFFQSLNPFLLGGIFLLIFLIVIYISYKISLHFYEKKEF